MNSDIQYFNSEEAAKILGVNVSTIKRWTDSGKLECIKTAGGHRKFLMKQLADFLARNKKKMSKANLFPLENETDLQISYHIMKGHFGYLIDHVEEQAFACNQAQIQHVLNGLYIGQYPLHEIYDKLVTPVLYKIGDLWEAGKISVIEEHFASQAIRDSVVRLQGIIRLPSEKSETVLCLNLSSELHDIALKMVEHVLESRGLRALFSGQITPLFKIEEVFEQYRPERVYLSSTVVADTQAGQIEFDEICRICEQYEAKMYVGGQGFDILNFDHLVVEKRMFRFEEVYLT